MGTIQQLMQKRLSLIFIALLLWQTGCHLTMAQTKKPPGIDEKTWEQLSKFPPSPLEKILPDPLLPPMADKEPLTSEEAQQLETALDQLDQEATATLQGGDIDAAFEIWNRELRLRRLLGPLSEIQALSRVGGIAWNQSQQDEVLYITARLEIIQQDTLSPQTTLPLTSQLEIWRSLGDAYQSVRSPKLALEAYNQVLALVRQQKDPAAEVDALNTIGELHLSWFDYPQAATTYNELLDLAVAQGNIPNQVKYLQTLAYIYDQSQQIQQAIDIRKKLAAIYVSQDELTQFPTLKLAIAADYEFLSQKNPSFRQQAFNNYQEAYSIAWNLQEYSTAGQALQKLIALYRSQGQIDEALQTSQVLIKTQQLADNYYGLMTAYDQMGQLYLKRNYYPQALAAFQQGLQIAQKLQVQEAYFSQQIQKSQQAIGKKPWFLIAP
jgi:tetratricopeptide (TPR) repeat protein